MTVRPESDEYAPNYQKYIDRVPDGDIAATLASQVENTLSVLRTLSEEDAGRAYAEGKWTIKQVLGHLIDTERIFAYRAPCIGRNDKTWLPGFEQDDYVANANFNARTLASLIEELVSVRRATVNLFKHFTDEEWCRRGIANQKEVSARAIAYMAAGHERHHLEILKSRYLFH
jgi:hypothetical protein